MSNKELIKSGYDAFKAGDMDTVMSLFHDDAEWQSLVGLTQEQHPLAGVRRGKQAVGEFFISMAQQFQFTNFEQTAYYEDGDTVFVLSDIAGTYPSTGKSIDTETLAIWKLRDGKAVSYREFTDTFGGMQAANP